MINLISGYTELKYNDKQDSKEQLVEFFKKVVPNCVLVEFEDKSNLVFHTEYSYNWNEETGLVKNIEATGNTLAIEFIKKIEGRI